MLYMCLKQKARPDCSGLACSSSFVNDLVVHSAHAFHAAAVTAAARSRFFLVRDFGDQAFGREQQTSDGRRVLQRAAGDLLRVHHARALTRSSYSPVAALKPSLPLRFLISITTTLPSYPPFIARCLAGYSMARLMISTPICSSSFAPLTASIAFKQRSNATPPPGTMPSSTAARMACTLRVFHARFLFPSFRFQSRRRR